MQEIKEKKDGRASKGAKKKGRHIVTWSHEEDDILRKQISIHGTENWGVIASKFKDKTTRQCRRRWYTYLNSDFKKGGWSPEEDMLLCEAQKIFGNRWTEIAKVVSGRTDNAVKNRFTTLCKKRAKYEALAKENKNSCINSNNKRLLSHAEREVPAKILRRSHILDHNETRNVGDRTHPLPRQPFTLLPQNIVDGHEGRKPQQTFLREDDPKLTALVQQAELLSSLALKINSENTDQNLENAWKELQDFLNRSKENDMSQNKASGIDLQLEDLKDLIEDLRSSNDGSQLSLRQPDLYKSPDSSEHSTGSTMLPFTNPGKQEQTQTNVSQSETEGQYLHIEDADRGSNITEVAGELFQSFDGQKNLNTIVSSAEFSSPIHVTPLFRSLAAGIPSPKFSESERNFLLKTLGLESPNLNNQSVNPGQPPSCKRALLQSP